MTRHNEDVPPTTLSELFHSTSCQGGMTEQKVMRNGGVLRGEAVSEEGRSLTGV